MLVISNRCLFPYIPYIGNRFAKLHYSDPVQLRINREKVRSIYKLKMSADPIRGLSVGKITEH